MDTTIVTHLNPPAADRIAVCRAPLPRFTQVISQAVMAGMLVFFGLILKHAIALIDYYKVLVVPALPEYLGVGALVGLGAGLAIWGVMKLLNDPLAWIPRLVIAALAVICVIALLISLGPTRAEPDVIELSPAVLFFGATIVVAIGVITGTNLDPWRGLGHGFWRVNPQQRKLTSIVGFALRLQLLYGCFVSILICVCILSSSGKRGLPLTLLITAYFLSGLIFTLANPNVWVGAIAGLILNAPWVVVLAQEQEHSIAWYFMFTLVLLWAIFIFTQAKFLRSIISVVREELRYYLID
jgi:hypothetical protein